MNKQTISGIRNYYKLPNDVTDKQIEKNLKGSFGETAVNLDMAIQRLKQSFGESIPKIFKKYFKTKPKGKE